MPVNKIYYTNPYLSEIKTKITSFQNDAEGIWYTFMESIFYPEGGGQAADQGWINNEVVHDVKTSEGEIWHLLKSNISDPVNMRLDWEARFTNMQQHTGQHILSACFKTFHNLDTLSVHLGSDITMIELDTPAIDQKVLEDTEEKANQIIRDNHQVKAAWIKRDRIGDYNLRREIKTEDSHIRLVHIGELDCVGCGGLHVESTAEVGLIKIVGVEKIRNHIRVRIKIGTSAYQYFDKLHQNLQNVSNRLTISIEDLSDRVESLIVENQDLSRKVKKVNELWMTEYAKNLKETELRGCFILPDFSKEQLKTLSVIWLELHQTPCLFLGEENDRTNFYIRIPEKSEKNIQDFIQKNKECYSLKGGGSKDYAVGEIGTIKITENFRKKLFNAFNNYLNEGSVD